jgi:hypothetical protein
MFATLSRPSYCFSASTICSSLCPLLWQVEPRRFGRFEDLNRLRYLQSRLVQLSGLGSRLFCEQAVGQNER